MYKHLHSLCHGCLSSDRNLFRLIKELSEIFYKLRNNEKYDKRKKDIQLCWECTTFLKRLKAFQDRIKTAESLLKQFLQNCYDQESSSLPSSLTSLTQIHINKYTNTFVEEEYDTSNDIADFNDSQSDINNDNDEIKTENKYFDEMNNENKLFDIDLVKDIKLERPEIKEELIGNDSDRIGNIKVEESLRKRKKDYNRTNKRKKYESLATVHKNTKINDSKFLSEIVSLSQSEYETVIKRDYRYFDYTVMSYKCMDCKVGYYKKIDLLRHTSFCHNKSPFPYKCNACTTIINSAEHLEEHWNAEHTKVLKCFLCQEYYQTNKDIRRHIKKEHSKLYKCNNCGQECGTFQEFIKHYKVTHETVICDYCNMTFTKKESLVKHMQRFHIPATCKLCAKTYSNHKGLRYHNQVNHPELFLGQDTKELSYCVECDRQYASVYKYQRHLQLSPRHTPRKKIRVPCPECGKIFTRTNFMKNHYKFAHLKVTKNYCEQCDKYYTTGYGLRQHINKVHKKISLPKNKICDICGRGFSTNKILTNHRRTHTGERPHRCKYCPAAFAQETSMKTHQRTQHKNICLEAS